MTISQKSISGFVSDMTATWAAQTQTSPVFSSGDPLLAFWQSVAVQFDFLQAQIAVVLALSRAQTSSGSDLDSWMAQFNFSRLPATFATGQENFIRLTPAGSPITVPAGAIVQTFGGGTQYQVVADMNDPTWNAGANGYIMQIGQTVLTPTVEALVGGSGSNIVANQLTQFGSSVPGIDQVTNLGPITNGVDGETDAAFRSRFILYLATLAKATKSAILAAAMGVQQGVLLSPVENEQPNGTPLPGSFTIVADDGSGNPPASLLNAIFNAVDQTRAFSVQPFVVPPTQIQATISLSVHLADPTAAASVNAAVQNAIAGAVNALGPGVTLYGSTIISAALNVSGVTSVNPSTLVVNNATADLVPTILQEIRTTTALIQVSNY